MLCLYKELLFLCSQPEEETGAAGGQPASNKAEGGDYRRWLESTVGYSHLFI